MSNRPHIPDDILRKVRQRCFFGCVICGVPIFEYDHIEEFSVVNRHDAENITLLCELHHGQKTKGRLDRDLLVSANASPFNKGKDLTAFGEISLSGLLGFKVGAGGGNIEYVLMDGHFAHVINIDFENILSVRRDGNNMLLSLTIYDEEMQVILNVKDGEIQYSTKVFDYELTGSKLIIRSEIRRLTYVIFFTAKGLVIKRGSFNGPFNTKVHINDNQVRVASDMGISYIQICDTSNKCVVALPDLAELADLDFAGNICSRRLFRRVKDNIEGWIPDPKSNYPNLLILYGNLLSALCKRYPYEHYKFELLAACWRSRAFFHDKEWQGVYASSSRTLARALYRFFPRDVSSLKQSISIFEEIINLEFMTSRAAELARLRKSLADSIIALNTIHPSADDLQKAIDLYALAEPFYTGMYAYDEQVSDIDIILRSKKIATIFRQSLLDACSIQDISFERKVL